MDTFNKTVQSLDNKEMYFFLRSNANRSINTTRSMASRKNVGKEVIKRILLAIICRESFYHTKSKKLIDLSEHSFWNSLPFS